MGKLYVKKYFFSRFPKYFSHIHMYSSRPGLVKRSWGLLSETPRIDYLPCRSVFRESTSRSIEAAPDAGGRQKPPWDMRSLILLAICIPTQAVFFHGETEVNTSVPFAHNPQVFSWVISGGTGAHSSSPWYLSGLCATFWWVEVVCPCGSSAEGGKNSQQF